MVAVGLCSQHMYEWYDASTGGVTVDEETGDASGHRYYSKYSKIEVGEEFDDEGGLDRLTSEMQSIGRISAVDDQYIPAGVGEPLLVAEILRENPGLERYYGERPVLRVEEDRTPSTPPGLRTSNGPDTAATAAAGAFMEECRLRMAQMEMAELRAVERAAFGEVEVAKLQAELVQQKGTGELWTAMREELRASKESATTARRDQALTEAEGERWRQICQQEVTLMREAYNAKLEANAQLETELQEQESQSVPLAEYLTQCEVFLTNERQQGRSLGEAAQQVSRLESFNQQAALAVEHHIIKTAELEQALADQRGGNSVLMAELSKAQAELSRPGRTEHAAPSGTPDPRVKAVLEKAAEQEVRAEALEARAEEARKRAEHQYSRAEERAQRESFNQRTELRIALRATEKSLEEAEKKLRDQGPADGDGGQQAAVDELRAQHAAELDDIEKSRSAVEAQLKEAMQTLSTKEQDAAARAREAEAKVRQSEQQIKDLKSKLDSKLPSSPAESAPLSDPLASLPAGAAPMGGPQGSAGEKDSRANDSWPGAGDQGALAKGAPQTYRPGDLSGESQGEAGRAEDPLQASDPWRRAEPSPPPTKGVPPEWWKQVHRLDRDVPGGPVASRSATARAIYRDATCMGCRRTFNLGEPAAMICVPCRSEFCSNECKETHEPCHAKPVKDVKPAFADHVAQKLEQEKLPVRAGAGLVPPRIVVNAERPELDPLVKANRRLDTQPEMMIKCRICQMQLRRCDFSECDRCGSRYHWQCLQRYEIARNGDGERPYCKICLQGREEHVAGRGTANPSTLMLGGDMSGGPTWLHPDVVKNEIQLAMNDMRRGHVGYRTPVPGEHLPHVTQPAQGFDTRSCLNTFYTDALASRPALNVALNAPNPADRAPLSLIDQVLLGDAPSGGTEGGPGEESGFLRPWRPPQDSQAASSGGFFSMTHTEGGLQVGEERSPGTGAAAAGGVAVNVLADALGTAIGAPLTNFATAIQSMAGRMEANLTGIRQAEERRVREVEDAKFKRVEEPVRIHGKDQFSLITELMAFETQMERLGIEGGKRLYRKFREAMDEELTTWVAEQMAEGYGLRLWQEVCANKDLPTEDRAHEAAYTWIRRQLFFRCGASHMEFRKHISEQWKAIRCPEHQTRENVESFLRDLIIVRRWVYSTGLKERSNPVDEEGAGGIGREDPEGVGYLADALPQGRPANVLPELLPSPA